jgi:ferrochelatase
VRFASEPAHAHGSASRTAVVLCNLGTPDAPTAAAVRRYLAEFLSDPRVVEIPRAAWLPILHGVVLRVRPARSARKYASIWMPEGSPLKVWTERQAVLLEGYLGQRGVRAIVRYAMRYGSPSIRSVLDAVKAAGADRILVVPLYPQYAASTTASVGDAVGAWLGAVRNVPEVRFVKHYHDDPGYIDALAARVQEHWRVNGRADRLVLSFHGLPRRSLTLGDPYHCECQKTGRLLAERLELPDGSVVVTFQSRFGRAEWLQPYTEPTLVAMARSGLARVDVCCPGFTSIASRRSRRSIRRRVRHSLRPAAASSATSRASTTSTSGSPPSPSSPSRTSVGWSTAEPSGRELQESKRRALAAGAKA